MFGRRVTSFLFLVFMSLGLSGCEIPYQWQQRMELIISTPEGEITASSVYTVRVHYTPKLLQMGIGAVRYENTGEAVVADLGGGRYLFALVPSAMIAEKTLPLGRASTREEYRRIIKMKGEGSTEISEIDRPALVTFDSLTDPKSMQLVDPNDLAATFGAGYSLESYTLSIVGAETTRGRIEKLLPWLSDRNSKNHTVLGEPHKAFDRTIPDREKFNIYKTQFDTELFR